MVGERVTIARNAGRPTSTFAIWTPGAKGISPKRAAPIISAVTGDMMKKNRSAPSGMISSLKSSLMMSANP